MIKIYLEKKYDLDLITEPEKFECNNIIKKYVYNIKEKESSFDVMFKFNIFTETFL